MLGPPPATALPIVDGTTESLTTNVTYPNEYIGNTADGTLNHSAGTNTVTGTNNGKLFLGGGSGITGTYNLSGTGDLLTNYEYLGWGGIGYFNQTGGTNTVIYNLRLGENTGSYGEYNLSSGTLSVGSTYVGYDGTGVFNQTGGDHIIRSGSLYLGYNDSASDGTYNLTGGTLDIARTIRNGPGTGTMNVDGGTLTVGSETIRIDNFNVGNAAGTTGNYTLTAGKNIAASNETIGYSGTGTFTQSGGTNDVALTLTLGNDSDSIGTYNLSGEFTVTLSATDEYIGYNGTGEFNQTGGMNTVSDALYLGYGAGSSGTYNLIGDGSAGVQADYQYIGYSGTGEFNQDGGWNAAWYNLYLGYNSGSSGTYNFTSGMLYTDYYEFIGYDATGTYDAGGDLIQAGGTVNQDGGTHYVNRSLYLGYNSGSTGTYNLREGLLSAKNERIGISGTGEFNQTGGTNDVALTLILGVNSGSSGTYNLSGAGDLSASNEYIGISGTGEFNQSGGTHTVTETLTIALLSGSSGMYDLSDGTLRVTNFGGTGEIINNDTFNYSGGTLNADIITNNANFNLSGTGTRTVNGDFTNTGTVKVTDTTVEYTGTFTNYGEYFSDPSDNFFTDLIVGDSGYLVGGVDDNFFISGDFLSTSTQDALWNTVDAYLEFQYGADGLHTMDLTGAEMGAITAGYTDNFAWGTMVLTDSFLTLADGNADTGGALYLGLIAGLDIVSGVVNDVINNITGNGFNIYYLADLADNDYLGGWTYNLIDGGQLIAIGQYTGGGPPPESVPEPSTMLLLAFGMIGLFAFRRPQVIRG